MVNLTLRDVYIEYLYLRENRCDCKKSYMLLENRVSEIYKKYRHNKNGGNIPINPGNNYINIENY